MGSNVVKQADEVMHQLMKIVEKTNPKTGRKYKENRLTTSQIRKFLIAVNTVTNKVNVYKSKNVGVQQLTDELATEVQYLKVKIVYQAGREATVKKFVQASKLLEYIDGIGTDMKKYDEFAHYVEALVAYHKFYGGQD